MAAGRVWVTVAVLLAGLDCSGKKHRAAAPPSEDAGPAPADYSEWKAAVAAERARTYDRPPLFPPAVPGKAADDYLPAVVVDVPIEVYSQSQEVLAGKVPWKKAPQVVRDYANSPEARAVADAILRGASRTDGKSIAPLRSDILTVLEGNPDLIIMLVALADAEVGQVDRACRYLLALQRLAQDLARGAPLVATLVARGYQRNAARLLRQLVVREQLTPAELSQLLAAYTRLIESQVTLGSALEIEALFTAMRAIETPLPMGEPESRRTQVLKRIAVERRIAAAIGDHASLDDRIHYYETESCRGEVLDHACREGSQYIAAIGLARADFLATYLYLALELDRRRRGQLAPTLAGLVPDTIPELPDDPIAGAPFGYLKVAGQPVIRRGATALDDQPDVEPRDIPAPGATH